MTSLVRLNVADHRINAALLVLLGTICLGSFVSTPVFAQSSVQRNQQALMILKQTIAAGGGQELLASVRDFTETGTITYNWADQVTGNVTVKSRGLHYFRMEADLADGKRTTVVNGEGGLLTDGDGRSTPIYRQSAAVLGSFTLPYLPLIAALQDSSTSIVFGGLVTHNGAPAYDLRLQRVFTEQQDPSGKRGAREARDFYIDPKTFLVVAISDRIQFANPRDESFPHEIPHEILYSNYQSENGTLAPLTIVETVQDVTGFTMNLTQVTFNSGLADHDFAW